jgi:dihydrofolate reductase
MRKIILNLAITLDGFIEGPNGELDWLTRDSTIDFADVLNEILSDKDSIFYGRKSYDKWGNFWPEEEASQKLKNAYHQMHGKQKYVFSRTKTSDGTGAVFINNHIKARVQEIKHRPGKDIWLYGGAELASELINLNLVDEYRLAVHPVVLGDGRPLFQDIAEKQKLSLVEAKGHTSGVVLLTYRTAATGLQ